MLQNHQNADNVARMCTTNLNKIEVTDHCWKWARMVKYTSKKKRHQYDIGLFVLILQIKYYILQFVMSGYQYG